MSRQIAIKILEEKGTVILSCNGNSMQPIMKPGDSLYIKKVNPSVLRKNDVVFCKIKGSLQVHKISAVIEDEQRFQISNNSGYVNGIIGANNIYGICVQVNDKNLISNFDLQQRST